MALFHLLPAVIALLEREGRVSYRALQVEFALDAAHLEALRDELVYAKRLAADEDGRVLVWTGGLQPLLQSQEATAPETAPVLPDTVAVSVPPALPPLIIAQDPESTLAVDGTAAEAGEAAPSATAPGQPVAATEAPRSAPEAERRQVTVLFGDLVDSTILSQQLDPEDYRAVVRAYQEAVATAVQAYEGYIAQYLGDGVLVYFGWPQAHEDAAVRAVHASLASLEALTAVNQRLEPQYGRRLAVRCGLHTGLAVIGAMGSGHRHESLALGDTPNLAARLQGLAAPDTVVLSAVTARLVQHAFTLEEMGTHRLKGVAEPMLVYRVLGPLEHHDDEDETGAAGTPVLVGRDEELGLLQRRWAQATEGLGQVVLLSGEAGIGKSSLVEVLRAHVRQAGGPRLMLRCSPYHQHSALYPVITHLEHLLRFARDDAPATKLAKLERGLRDAGLGLDEMVPLVAALLAVPLDGHYAAPQLTPPQQKQRTLDALGAWLLAEAARQPVLAVWDDLHWADPSTLELLGLILEQTPTVPMLHVLTFRPEFVPPWPTRSHLTPMTLTRLERPHVEALLTHLTGGTALPGEVIEHIVTKTDGVPLYVEELTKMLLESDLLRADDDGYTLTGPLTSLTIPTTLQDALLARLDRLGAAKEVAQCGAVIGREFAYAMLRAVSPQDDETLQAALAQLVNAELLYQRGRPPRAAYRFKHALIQEAAYASLLRRIRQQLHQQIARQLEARFPATVETQPEFVAYHYTEAGCLEQAIGYWHQAGHQAWERQTFAEAIPLLTRGLELLRTLPETAARDHQEIQLLRPLGAALMGAKGQGVREVRETYSRLWELCKTVDDPTLHVEVLYQLRVYHSNHAEHRNAIAIGEEVLRIAQRTDDRVALARAQHGLGRSLFYHGMFCRAMVHYSHLLRPDELATDFSTNPYAQDAVVTPRSATAMLLWVLGHIEQAHQQLQEGLAFSHQARTQIQGIMQLWAVLFYATRREWAIMHKTATRLHAFATEKGLPQPAAVATSMLGWWRVVLGHDPDGMSQLRQGIQAYNQTVGALYRPYWLARLAEAHAQQGNMEAALASVAEALEAMHATEEYVHHAELCRLKGTLLLQGAVERQVETEACLQEALDVARSQEAKSWELRAATSLARLWQSQDKRQAAYDLLAPVYGWFTEGFETADLQEAKGLLEELAG